MDDENADASLPHYRWPWFVLAAVVLGVVLAIIWVGVAAHRIREQRISAPQAAPMKSGPSSIK